MFHTAVHISSGGTARRRAANTAFFSSTGREGVTMNDKLCSHSREGRDPKAFRRVRGFTMLELLIVIAIGITVASIAIPQFLNAWYIVRLKTAAGDLSAFTQRTRMQAARANATYTVAYRAATNVEEVYMDLNNNNQWDAGEPLITFSSTITPMAGAPSGTGGQPTPYVLVGDTAGTTYDNSTTLGYSPRGLPCAYTAGVCATPAAGYFVYYLQDARRNGTGYAAVIVTRSGRSKVAIWNGASWD
jgi:prepilin-type N-terminal cleavage/methylation domain-containing protein